MFLFQVLVSEGLTMAIRFTPYLERFHGRIAILGLSTLILVEAGEEVIKFHPSGKVRAFLNLLLHLCFSL